MVITFDRGRPVKIDGQTSPCCRRSEIMNARAGAHGIGRIDVVEDRLVGIKSREIYESPGPMALITAHMELMNVTVERELLRYSRGSEPAVGANWSTTDCGSAHCATPLDGLLEDVNASVSGEVRMTLQGGRGRHRPSQRCQPLRLRPGDLTTPVTRSTSRWRTGSSNSGPAQPHGIRARQPHPWLGRRTGQGSLLRKRRFGAAPAWPS